MILFNNKMTAAEHAARHISKENNKEGEREKTV